MFYFIILCIKMRLHCVRDRVEFIVKIKLVFVLVCINNSSILLDNVNVTITREGTRSLMTGSSSFYCYETVTYVNTD